MRLHVFVEGIDDENFFKHFIERCLKQYNIFKYSRYKDLPKEQILIEIKTALEEQIDYIFLGDFDFRDKNRLNIKDKETEITKEWKIHKTTYLLQ